MAVYLLQQWQVDFDINPDPYFACSGGLARVKEYHQQRRWDEWGPLAADQFPSGKLVIIRNGGLGDILLLQPAIRRFKEVRPDISVQLVTDSPQLGNADDNTDRLEFAPDVPILMLNEFVEQDGEKLTRHRSDIFAKGMGLEDCGGDYEMSLPRKWPRIHDGPYAVVQYSGSNLFRCPSLEYMDAITAALPIPVVALAGAPMQTRAAFNETGFLEVDRLLSIIQHASVVIAGDSGPFHIARALHTACIGLYGPIPSDIRVGWKPDNCVILGDKYPKEWACGPCQESGFCSKIGMAKCLDAIPAEQVIETALALLE